MKRRDLLKYIGAGFLGAGLFASGKSMRLSLPFARASAGKTLVVIFQRGGCDGLNVVVPYGDDEYYNLRPTIAVPLPGSSARSALRLNGFFGLHPSLSGLFEIYNDGHLAVMPAVHYPDGNRSHFDSEVIVESGSNRKLYDGWLGRYLESHLRRGTPLQAVVFGNVVPHAMRGKADVATFNDISKFGLGNDDYSQRLLARLTEVYDQPVRPGDKNRFLLYENGKMLLKNIEFMESLDLDHYEPQNGASYPNTSYGRQLMQVAQLIKLETGIELATVDIGGWDTHSNQGGAQENGRHSIRLKEFSEGITALYKDLGRRMEDVLILTMTEFGRTAKQNASGGTDHGNASAWFAVGGQVHGGIYGDWPGLSESELYEGRYLAHTVDCRDVMGEVLSNFLGASNMSHILPGHAYKPIGFL